MALNPQEKFSSATRAAFPRITPAPDGIQPKTLAADAGAVVLPMATPMGVVTASGHWKFWDDGASDGSEDIRGFLFEPDGITGDTDEELLINIMLMGTVHLDDLPLVSGNTLANLKTALQTGVRERGIIVQGLELFR